MLCTCVPFELSKWALPWNLKIKVSGSLVLVFTQTRLRNPHSRMSNWFWVTTGVKWLYKIAFELVNTGLWAFEQDKEESWQELIKMKKGKDICESPMPMVRGKWVLVKRGKRVMAWQWVGSKQGLCPSPCPCPIVHVHVHWPSKGERRWWLGSVGKQAGRVHVQLTGSDVIPNVMRGVVFQEAHHSEKSPLNLLSSNMFSDLSSNYFIPLFLVELESPLDRLKIYCPSKNAAWRGGSS